MLLTKALKQAHTFIGSAQLVGQVSHKSIETNRLFIEKHLLNFLVYHIQVQILNVLAPIQRDKDDASGAKQMLESATTLLKSVGDLPCLIYTLQMLSQLNVDEKHGQLKMKEYLDRKAADWETRLKGVSSCDKHKQLLELCPWLINFSKSL